MHVQDAEYLYDRGIPALRLMIDGREAIIDCIQTKSHYLENPGAVYLGGNWESVTSVEIEDAEKNITRQLFYGYTDDPTVVALALRYFKDLTKGAFSPRRLTIFRTE